MPVRRGERRMPCESCAVQFSVFRRKRACSECERYYCSGCLRRGGGAMCAACRVLSARPLSRHGIAHLKVRDLQCFLQRQNVSTRGCVEKEELVNLCVSHVNSAAYRRHGPRTGTGPFSSLKGFTNNINVLINSAFDLRNPQSAPPPPNSNCHNASHAHPPPPSARERFTTTPGGERALHVPVPDAPRAAADAADARRETADCFEIEDLDDAGWEFVTRPADPLPNDSEVLIAENETSEQTEPPEPAESVGVRLRVPRGVGGGGTPLRAASELELRQRADDDAADSASLQDEPLMDHSTHASHNVPTHITLEQIERSEQLEELSVKQLKELLQRNRVEYRGCLERGELLARARTLWRDHEQARAAPEDLPLEDCCKICMAAPLQCVLLECGHMAACTSCAKQLAECPICRQYVVRAVRVFRS